MKCQKCDYMNSEHVAYCGGCGERLGESELSPHGSAEEITSAPTPNDTHPLAQSRIQKNPTRLRQFSPAAIAAIIGAILLIAAAALTIYWYELIIDGSADDWELRANVAKAMTYSQMLGIICVVLSILLLVQNSLARYRRGVGLSENLQIPLSQMRYLVIFALVSVTIAFGLYILLAEVQPDLDRELTHRLWSLPVILRHVAWASLAMMLFLAARRMK